MANLSNRVVSGLFASKSGGAPKPSVPSLEVKFEGCIGDYQRDKKNHGGPKRAVCIFSQDVIHDLNEEGHPINPGDCGENIVLTGIDWKKLSPGVCLQIGSSILRLESDAPPCKTIAHAFSDGQFRSISYKLHPERTRWYCSVLKEGLVTTGDFVKIV